MMIVYSLSKDLNSGLRTLTQAQRPSVRTKDPQPGTWGGDRWTDRIFPLFDRASAPSGPLPKKCGAIDFMGSLIVKAISTEFKRKACGYSGKSSEPFVIYVFFRAELRGDRLLLKFLVEVPKNGHFFKILGQNLTKFQKSFFCLMGCMLGL